MRPGASHPGPHQTWVPAPCLSHRGSGAVTASARQPSQRVPHVAEAAADAWCCNHESATAAWPAALPACKQVGGGGRKARATSFALARSFWKFPPGNSLSPITGCHWPAAIIQQAQELSRFAAHTLIEFKPSGNTKRCGLCEQAVEDATSLWKREEN